MCSYYNVPRTFVPRLFRLGMKDKRAWIRGCMAFYHAGLFFERFIFKCIGCPVDQQSKTVIKNGDFARVSGVCCEFINIVPAKL